jgi:hypothetical protein
MKHLSSARFFLPLTLLAGGLLLAGSFAPAVRAAAAQDHGGKGKEREGEEEDTKLAGIMQRIRGDMKRLGKEIEGKDQAAAWKTICSVQQHILEAKQESPDSAKAKNDAERPAFVNAFRAKISELLKASCDLEAAILANKFDDAAKVHQQMFGPMQKAGHKQFRGE